MPSVSQMLDRQGFVCVGNIFTAAEIQTIASVLEVRDSEKSPHFRTHHDLFAIRCLLQEKPDLYSLFYTEKMAQLLEQVQPGARLVKAIFFNKPVRANWIVNWHQDLTVNVRQKADVAGFGNWTYKEGYFAVHPPVSYLHQTVTIRIHLDDCDASNGALRVVPGSHREVRHIQQLPHDFFTHEITCPVPAGGVMLMKPLLWHSSRRTENNRNRRVIHLEFCSEELPCPLQWHERV